MALKLPDLKVANKLAGELQHTRHYLKALRSDPEVISTGGLQGDRSTVGALTLVFPGWGSAITIGRVCNETGASQDVLSKTVIEVIEAELLERERTIVSDMKQIGIDPDEDAK